MAPSAAITPPTAQAARTRRGEPRSASRKPLVVKTPVPIIAATTSAVALPNPTVRSPLTIFRIATSGLTLAVGAADDNTSRSPARERGVRGGRGQRRG